MILVTCATGTAGRAAVAALAARGAPVRAHLRDTAREAELRCLGAREIVLGDVADEDVIRRALQGIRAVYLITPPLSDSEIDIGRGWIAAAQDAGVGRFVYHSVAHPQIRAMPHHWDKLKVEAALIDCGLAATILQPTSYMQNILRDRDRLMKLGELAAPLSVDMAMNIVDADDVGEAAARVLTEPGHEQAIYELGGPESLTRAQMAEILTDCLGRPVRAVEVSMRVWLRRTTVARTSFQRRRFAAMYRHYDAHGVPGNPNVLAMLLGRPPTDFRSCTRRLLRNGAHAGSSAGASIQSI